MVSLPSTQHLIPQWSGCSTSACAKERKKERKKDGFLMASFFILVSFSDAFAAPGPGLWNSLPSRPKEANLQQNRFRRLLDISVWIVGPRRNVNYFNYTV